MLFLLPLFHQTKEAQLRKFSEFLLIGLSLCVFTTFLSVAILDWVGGCGETYEYANGTLHQGECAGRDLFRSLTKEVLK